MMSLFGFFRFRTLVTLALVGVFAAAGYGFAAANTVSESGAGDGQSTISGYTTGNISYTLNSTNPANIDSVSFSLTPTAGAPAPVTVRVKLVSSSSTWHSCAVSASTWNCSVSGVTVAQANELRVVAAQ
jgi:hypothetical protein